MSGPHIDYEYRDQYGATLFVVRRYVPKRFEVLGPEFAPSAAGPNMT